jgi:N-methylhydantoinase A
VSAYSFRADGWRDFAVIERDTLASGETFEGPAVMLEPTTTTYVDAGLDGVVHESGALVLRDSG